MKLDLGSLREVYKTGSAKPSDIIAAIYEHLGSQPDSTVWISVVPRDKALARARKLEKEPLASAHPLYGVPFAIQDNIDLAGLPANAGCPAYAYSPARSATVVQSLLDAGAIPIGKTNLDQFAAGLTGTCSPYGACSSLFDTRYIAGGASSGAAAAVGRGLVSFSLGTDTAGGGRIPAAFNNLVGLKPTRGLLSSRGVVPGCRTLDSVSIFAMNCSDAYTAWMAARGFDAEDLYSREPRPGQGAAAWAGGAFRFGIPAAEQLDFFGDDAAAALYGTATAAVQRMGGQRVEVDFAAFTAASVLLDKGPWAAERYAALAVFLKDHGEAMDPVVRGILEDAARLPATDWCEAEYRLAALRRASAGVWENADVLLLPTTGTIYTHEEVNADPAAANRNLGRYTGFVNLLDLAAVAAPAGFRSNGLPFGVSFIGPAFTDEALLALADRFHRVQGEVPGEALALDAVPGCIAVAMTGGYLSGQPLNYQLTSRGGRLLRLGRTAPGYRLYALEGTIPPKPGLVRDDQFRGPGIEVEVWAVPEDQFGGFMAAIPAPLGIGNVAMDDGDRLKCLICEPYALQNARDITRFGGWRSYLSQSVLTR